MAMHRPQALLLVVMLTCAPHVYGQSYSETFERELNIPTDGGWTFNQGGIAADAGEEGVDDHALNYATDNNFHFLHPANGGEPNPLFLGNYVSKGATRISLRARANDVQSQTVQLRAYVFPANAAVSWAISNAATAVGVDDDWEEFHFDLCPDSLITASNGLSATEILSDVRQIGFRHDPAGTGPGVPVPVVFPTTILFDDVTLSTGEPCGLAQENFGDLGTAADGGWSTGSGAVAINAGDAGIGDHALRYLADNPTGNNGFHLTHPRGGASPNEAFLGNHYDPPYGSRLSFRARHSFGDEVVLRAVVFDDDADGLDWAQTAETVTVSDSDWQSFELDLCRAGLIAGGDNDRPAEEVLSNVRRIGLRHDPAGTGPGTPSPVTAPTEVYFDDIRRTTIPCGLPDRCGDGQVDANESCDDANRTPGDGCSETCQSEDGFMCVNQPPAGPSDCVPVAPIGEGHAYTGVVTLCTGTCSSFDALDFGSTIAISALFDVEPGGDSFTDDDLLGLQISATNDFLPPAGPGFGLELDNPMFPQVISVGSFGTTGEDDEFIDGQLMFRLFAPPFDNDDAWLIFDLQTGSGKLCLFFTTAGCIPGATEVMVIQGGFDFVGIDRDGDGFVYDDNCRFVANPDQRDTDGDDFGNVCDADLNNDCIVNFADLGIMKAAFFTSEPNPDLDGDGAVNFADLGMMKTLFFAPPGPSDEATCPSL